MALDIFRRKQKMIYWVVAIIVIPSFVILWGGPGSALREGDAGPAVARINGVNIPSREFWAFQRHLGAALGTRYGFFYAAPPETWGKNQGEWSTAIAMAYLQAAKETGLRVSEVEIGTFIRDPNRNHRFWDREAKPPGFSEKKLDEVLKRLRVTRASFKQGVRDWLLIKKFITLMDNTALASGDSAYAAYAQEKTKYTYQKLKIRITDQMKDDALKIITGVTAKKPKGDSAVLHQKISAYLASRAQDRRFWTPARWRLEYILAPYDAPEVVKDIKILHRDINGYYKRHKREKFKDKKLAEVRKQIHQAVLKEKKKEEAQSTFREQLEYFIRENIGDNSGLISREAFLADEILKSRGIKIGDSGDKPLAAEEMPTPFKEAQGLAPLLQTQDRTWSQIQDPEKRRREIEKLTGKLDWPREPLAAKTGMLRVRILDYVPGKQRRLKDDKGYLDGDLEAMVREELRQEEASELARKVARQYADMMRQNKTEGLKELVTETDSKVSSRLQQADLLNPILRKTDAGWEVLMLIDRASPSHADFTRLPASERQRYLTRAMRALRGRSSYQFWTNLHLVQPGARLSRWTQKAVQEGRIHFFLREDEEKQTPRP